MTATSQHYIDAENVHNWTPRWADKPYFADLSASARAAMLQAHRNHANCGWNARDCAEALCDRFPSEFIYG